MRVNAEAVRVAAVGRWVSTVFPLTAPELGPAIFAFPRHVACPVHGGRNGDAFRLYPDAEVTGGAVCNTCGPRANGFELLRWLRGWEFPKALAAVAGALGMAPNELGVPCRPVSSLSPSVTTPRTESAKTRALCRRLWHEGGGAADRLPLAYLRARGADLRELPPDLRGSPSLQYYAAPGRPLGVFPAMLALLRGGNGDVRGLHRTYLNPRRPAKAQILDPDKGLALPIKKILAFAPGSCAGCAVRLGEPSAGRLAVCEGIENAAAIQAATGVPTWAAYSAGAMAKLELPPGVSRVDLWPDFDPAGKSAAVRLIDRCRASGVAVSVYRMEKDSGL